MAKRTATKKTRPVKPKEAKAADAPVDELSRWTDVLEESDVAEEIKNALGKLLEAAIPADRLAGVIDAIVGAGEMSDDPEVHQAVADALRRLSGAQWKECPECGAPVGGERRGFCCVPFCLHCGGAVRVDSGCSHFVGCAVGTKGSLQLGFDLPDIPNIDWEDDAIDWKANPPAKFLHRDDVVLLEAYRGPAKFVEALFALEEEPLGVMLFGEEDLKRLRLCRIAFEPGAGTGTYYFAPDNDAIDEAERFVDERLARIGEGLTKLADKIEG